MPDNKRFSLRIKIIDGLLRKMNGASMNEILQVVNSELERRGICPVKSRETIFLDFDEISNTYHVRILYLHDKLDRRIIRYRYEDVSFSVFNYPLSDDDIKEIKNSLDVLSLFQGFPQCEWVEWMCTRFDVACEVNGYKVVQFEECCVKLGMDFFSSIFHAILRKKTAAITYKRFTGNAREHIVFPYYLKQYKRRWYLVARSSRHLDTICIFSLDRISSFEVKQEIDYVPIDVDINEYFQDVIGITRPDYGTPITIRFYANAELLPYLITNPIHQSQKIVVRNNVGAILSIHVVPTPELLTTFLSFGANVRIITSCSLKQEILENCKRIMRFYGSSI